MSEPMSPEPLRWFILPQKHQPNDPHEYRCAVCGVVQASVDEMLEWLGTDIECAQRMGARPKNADYRRWRDTVEEIRAALANPSLVG